MKVPVPFSFSNNVDYSEPGSLPYYLHQQEDSRHNSGGDTSLADVFRCDQEPRTTVLSFD